MAISITHKKVSTVPDEADTSLVRPSDWNDTHDATGIAASGANSDITSLSGVTGGISSPDYIQFDVNPSTTPTTPGALYWDSADGNQTLSLVMANGDAVQQIGQEQYYRIKASSAITNGQVVMFTGSVGASGALTGAPATGLTASTASYIMGIATQDIALNGWGYVTSFGLVRNLDTSAFTDGAILYYDPTVAGGLTTTIPSAPNAKIQVCAVTHAATNGSLFVRPTFGGILGQYEGDVGLSAYANGQTLIRDESSGKWVNSTLTAGTGVSVTNGAGSITVTNTAPDQTVAISAGTGISVSGTYPNFTVTNTSPSSGGTVTSVSGTAPIASSGGNTPAISISQATTSTDGYLSSTDWNTFNNKQPAGTYVTSVGATSPVTSTGGTTPTIAIPQATSSVSGYLSSTDWTTFNSKGSGTVTSVGITAGTGISVSGSPITSSGSITVTNSSPMTYPGSGIAVSTGSAWGTSKTSPSGDIVGTTDTQTLTNKTLTTPSISSPTMVGTIVEDVYTITDGAGFAIDPTNGSIQLITLGASRTPTAANWDAGEGVTLMVADGTAYTITWTTIGVVWVGGSAPTLATTGYTVIELWKVGSTIYGALVGDVA